MGSVPVLLWLAACFFIAAAGRSMFHFGKLRFPDGAFSVSLGLGICFIFLGVWFVCSLTGLGFNSVTCFIGYFISIVFSCVIRHKAGYFSVDEIKGTATDRTAERKRFLLGFLFFALLFFLACYVKGFKAFIDHQTEQYMDFSLMKAMYRQQRLPFEDIWFAGKSVNYYYLGQAVAVFMCRFSHVLPEYGYNLMLCTIFSFLTMSVCGLIGAFLYNFFDIKKGIGILGAVISGLLCSCGGNGHYIIYGILKRVCFYLKGNSEEYSYWFPSSTMFIGAGADALDKGKHEFPSYTLVLGDLHAHVCNMMFTIPLLAVLIDHVLSDDEDGKRKLISYHIVVMGLLLGFFRGSNYWDFPIYYVVCGAVILFSDLERYGFNIRVLANVLIKGAIIYLIGWAVMLPFELQYEVPATGIHLCHAHSPIGSLMIIWFPYLISAIASLVYAFGRLKAVSGNDKERHGALILIALTLCGLGLILLPEIIFVQDIYGIKYERYNTMFKLTFQAYILLSMVMGSTTALLINEVVKGIKKGSRRRICIIFSSLMLVMSLLLTGYMPRAVRSWFGQIHKFSYNKGISAVDFIRDDQSYDDVREAIRILNLDKRKDLHIVEEAGLSYCPDNRLSVFTGAVSVCGWFVHEWVWRNDPDAVRRRNDEVRYFYESGDRDYCREFAGTYDIDYIFVGSRVREKYKVDPEGFKSLGDTVWENEMNGYMLIRLP